MICKYCPGCGKNTTRTGFLVYNNTRYCYDCIRKLNLEICMVCLDLVDAGNFVSDGGSMICRDCAASRGLNNCWVCNDFTLMNERDSSVCDDCHSNSIRFTAQRE